MTRRFQITGPEKGGVKVFGICYVGLNIFCEGLPPGL